MIRLLLIIIVLFVSVIGVSAQDRGVNLKGQAYRTDNDGNEIVDYIAELEITIDAQNRRIEGLERELAQKNQLGDKRAGILEERTIEERSAEELKSPQPDPRAIEALSQKINYLQTKEEDCRRENERLAFELQTSEGDLQARSNANNEQLARKTETDEAVLYRKELEGRLQLLREANQEKELLLNASSKRIEELEEKVEQLKKDFAQVNLALSVSQNRVEVDEYENVKRQLQAKTSLVVELQEALHKSKSEAPSARVVASSLEDRKSGATIAVPGNLGQSRERAVESIKGRLASQLNELKSLVQERDVAFTANEKSGSPIKIKPTAARSSRGLTIKEIEGRLKAQLSMAELSNLTKDIAEIRGKIQDDLQVIKRTGRR